jgi:hypothetical protein
LAPQHRGEAVGVTPRDYYRGRIKRWTAHRDAASARADAISRFRLVTFFAGGLALVGGLRDGSVWLAAAGGALLVLFAYLVVRHARVLDEVARAQTAIAIGAEGLARLARDWAALPEIAPPPALSLETHPYARDLDLYGHASLTKWLGPAATRDGGSRLAVWLLAPATVDAAMGRQAAIDELSARREWRETFAVEGRLAVVSVDDLTGFLAWAESSEPAVPKMLQVPAIVLAAIAVSALPLWWWGGLDAIWWQVPIAVNLTLSFAFAKRALATFDKVSVGERVLERYAALLSLVCDESWGSPELERLQSSLGRKPEAPAMLKKLARLAQWSEVRSGAPIVHLAIQALTLWDFHVVFALERWRARVGHDVRSWLDALGSFDALAVLSRVRADEPDWTSPRIDPESRALIARALGHPLIADDRRVANDVHVGPPGTLLFVTGSNMSGKSTLLRAIGLNAVLAQAGAPVCAASLIMPPVELYTSIRVEDSLEHGVSYFMAALARLKQIVDAAERARNPAPDASRRILLYLLDEVLQGTNSVERALAVRAVVRHLLDAGAIGAVTSHDLALAEEEPIKSAASLVHFTEQVDPDGTMRFDYRLRPGLATSRNAIRLMQLIGITPR